MRFNRLIRVLFCLLLCSVQAAHAGNVPLPIPSAAGGSGLTDSGTDATYFMGSNASHGFVMAIPAGGSAVPGGSSGQQQYNNSGAFGGFTQSGDVTVNTSTGVATLANTAVTAGSYLLTGVTVDAKGRLTAASSATLTSADIWVGNGSNVPTAVALSGDATLSNAGALTLANTAVTPASYTNANITVDSKGRITAAANGTSGSTMDPGKRIGYVQTLGLTTSYVTTQNVSTNVANTYLAISSKSGQQLTTGASIGNSAYLQDAQSPNVFTFSQLAVVTFLVSPIDTANVRLWFGCFTPTIQDADTLAASGVTGFGIRDSTVAGDANFQFITSDGSADTVIDTGVPIATNTVSEFTFDTSSGTSVDLYYNGTLIKTSTTHLPAGSTALDWILRLFTEANAAKSFWFGRLYWTAF